MSENNRFEDISAQLFLVLPDLRRYARSLTGTQRDGDRFAEATLEFLGDTATSELKSSSLRVVLFRAFHTVWHAQGAPSLVGDDPETQQAQTYLNAVTPLSREALLLNTVEEFEIAEIAEILGESHATVSRLLDTAYSEMQSAMSGKILVIEDEPVIAMELQDILVNLGHSVIGAAATYEQAVLLAQMEKPDLILSDIQLADGSSGIDAVADILQAAGTVPTIYITAYPERMTTGIGNEPAFVIPKPYSDKTVMSAVSQAMFFADTSGIQA